MNQPSVSNYCLGLVIGYAKGYEKGLYALESQVPYSVKGMWKAASKEAAKEHFTEDPEVRIMYEQCVKNELAVSTGQ